MNRLYKITILILFVLMVQTARQTVFCQRISAGISGTASVEISERWTGLVELTSSFDKYKGYSHWGKVMCGATFKVYDGITAFGCASLALSDYYGTTNEERIMELVEGVIFHTKSGFEHQLYVDQRRLNFRPSNMTINSSRFGYTLYRRVALPRERWTLVPYGACVVNIKSEVASCDILQRVKLGSAVEYRLRDLTRVGLRYIYMFGGEEQTYMGDSHNLHVISLFVGLGGVSGNKAAKMEKL